MSDSEDNNFGLADLDEEPSAASASSLTTPAAQKKSLSKRPVQVQGSYPVRKTTYYLFSNRDIRSIGYTQAASAIFAAFGTFALSVYLDFSKDLRIIEESNKTPDEYMENVSNVSLSLWIIFWLLALAAFWWQKSEIRRIKEEHGELTFLTRFINKWKDRWL